MGTMGCWWTGMVGQISGRGGVDVQFASLVVPPVFKKHVHGAERNLWKIRGLLAELLIPRRLR